MEKEVFVPLYISNICHSRCKICNLQVQNKKVRRIQGNKKKLEEQLEIIYNIEKIKEICFLTGELVEGQQRQSNLEFVVYAIKCAFQYGYRRVFFNIGSLTDKEIQFIHRHFPNDKRIVLSLFQETYDKDLYIKYFGSNSPTNPKSDYERRFTTPERWVKMGFSCVDLGILIGLNQHISWEINALIEHATYIHKLGAEVYLSVPRIYYEGKMMQAVSEEEFINCICQMKSACPWAKLIITSRETISTIRKVLEYVDVVSPGSSDVMPYTWNGDIPNDETTSQFQVAKRRMRPSELLGRLGIENKIYVSGEIYE